MTRWFNEYHYHIIIKEKEEQRIADSRQLTNQNVKMTVDLKNNLAGEGKHITSQVK